MTTTHTSTHRITTGIIELSRWAFALVALGTAGCALDSSDAELPDGTLETPSGAESLSPNSLSPNSLSPNSLSPNSLSPNSLSPNSLSPNSLSPNSLSAGALTSLNDTGEVGERSRQLLKFAVGCAFGPTQSFTFTWTDANGVEQSSTYGGLLGLAPSWADGPLEPTGQRWVTACLAARTNRYGVKVMLSLRGNVAPLKTLDASEQTAYPRIEGGFWGNIFSDSPTLRACYNPENAANSRAAMRDCAAGQVDDVSGALIPCANIEIVGPCSSVCSSFNFQGRYYSNCEDESSGGPVQMITSALPLQQ